MARISRSFCETVLYKGFVVCLETTKFGEDGTKEHKMLKNGYLRVASIT